jgi:hypothetical protein
VILGQQTGHGLEFSKIQSENCFHGRESPGSKEFKRIDLYILPNSAFGCPTHDLNGFSYSSLVTGELTCRKTRLCAIFNFYGGILYACSDQGRIQHVLQRA